MKPSLAMGKDAKGILGAFDMEGGNIESCTKPVRVQEETED